MQAFNLNNTVDKNKVFIIKHSQIEGRLDPSIYQDTFNFLSKKYPNEKLFHIAYIDPQTSFSSLDKNDEISFIPMDAIDESTGTIRFKYSKNVSNTKGFTRFKQNDLIWAKITPCMQNGKSAVIKNTLNGFACGSTEFFVIRPKNEDILVDYIYILLRDERVLKSAMNYFGGSAGQQRVSKLYLERFNIPFPPINVQKQIVKLYNNALSEKKQKQLQAQQLLESIDTYLLKELGIALPQKDNSLQKRIFTTKFSQVSGERLDPKLYCNSTFMLKEAIKHSKYESFPLKTFVIQSVSGDWGNDISSEVILDTIKCLVIRATEFDNNYNLNLDNSRVKYRQIYQKKYQKMDLQDNDLLIEKSGGSDDQPVGRISLITKNILEKGNIGYSNFIHKIRVDGINPKYLFCYLKVAYNIKITDSMQSQTNGIRNLIMGNYFNQNIPLPPISKQKEIATHIEQIRNQAKQLQDEAEKVLQSAKQQIEKLIIGEEL